MSHVQALFYDAGFTLIEPAKSIPEMCAEALERRGHPTEAEAVHRAVPPFDPFLESMQSEGDLVFASDDRITDLWHRYYRSIFHNIITDGRLSDDELHECAVEVTNLYQQWDHWKPYPEVLGTLTEGRRRGLVQGVVSDWGSHLIPILHGLGLSDYLDFVVVSAVVGAAKPESHLFELALQRSGVAPEAVLYVGDNYRNDVLGGRGVGIRSVLINRWHQTANFDCDVVDRLDELFSLIV